MHRVVAFWVSLAICITAPLAAQQKREVLLKFSKQDGMMRVVFEGDETCIGKIKVTTSPSQIKLEFPEPFHLTSQKDLPFEIEPSEKSVIINLKEKAQVKFFRLSAPSRLVLDILKEEQQGKPSEKSPEKQPEQQLPVGHPIKVLIDAGHGGYDFGLTYGSINEKDLNLTLARGLGAALAKKGNKVFFIRKVDQYVSIAERIRGVNEKLPDIFISLHASMSPNFILFDPSFDEQGAHDSSISGSQRKYAGKSKLLSDYVEKSIRSEFQSEVIRRKMPLPLLHSANAPTAFLEYPSPKIVGYDQQMQTRLINAIVNGITAYGGQ